VLGAALAECPRLTHLDLGDNTFKADGARALARALCDARRAPRTLTFVSVADLSLGARGCREIILALAHEGRGAALTHLDFGCNEMGRSGVATLIANMRHFPRLAYLGLELNEVGNAGARALGAALRDNAALLPELATLDLKDNEMSGRSALCVARALGARAAEGALRAVHFAENAEIAPRAAAAIAECLGDAFVPFEGEFSFYVPFRLRESYSQFDSLPRTSLTISPRTVRSGRRRRRR
jgi:Ran GTPase-activating protein (RanGAP) involved in mRNA processing and transport